MAITRRKGAPKHYFLSYVVCLDPLCRKVVGWKKKQNKRRFRGYKKRSIPRRNTNKPYVVQQDSSYLTLSDKDTVVQSKKFYSSTYDRIGYNNVTRFRNANFETNSILFSSEFKKELDEFAIYLSHHREISVRIIGHTDDIGSYEDNQKLSLNRAKKVIGYLVSIEIDSSRFIPEGNGNTNPLVLGKTKEARMVNRRVEFELINSQ